MTCQVRGSEKLKEIMKKILHLGNTLNQGTARGNGISLCAKSIKSLKLLKLSQVKEIHVWEKMGMATLF